MDKKGVVWKAVLRAKEKILQFKQYLVVILILFLGLSLAMGVYLVQQRQLFRPQAASTPRLYFASTNSSGNFAEVKTPLSFDFGDNQEKELEIMVSPAGKNITGIDFTVEFEDFLESIEPYFSDNLDGFETIIDGDYENNPDNSESGKRTLRFVSVKKDNPALRPSSSIKLGTLKLKAEKSTGGAAKTITIGRIQVVATTPVTTAVGTNGSSVSYKVDGVAEASATPTGVPDEVNITSPKYKRNISAENLEFNWDQLSEPDGRIKRVGLRVVKAPTSNASATSTKMGCSSDVVVDQWWYVSTSERRSAPKICDDLSAENAEVEQIASSSLSTSWSPSELTLSPGRYFVAVWNFDTSYKCSQNCEGLAQASSDPLEGFTSRYYFNITTGPTATPTIGPSPTPTAAPACGGINLRADFNGDCCIGDRDEEYLIANWTGDKNDSSFARSKRFDQKTDLQGDGDVDVDDRDIYLRLYRAGPQCVGDN